MAGDSGALRWLERHNAALFVIAGVLTGITATLSALGTYMNAADTGTGILIAPFAFALIFLGLLGLYPRLVERTPRLARVGAGFAVLGAVLAPLLALVGAVDLLGLLAGEVPVWAYATHLLGRHSGQVGFVLFSVAVLRTDVYPRRIGYLLLAPATIMLLALTSIIVGAPQWTTPPLVGIHALAMLAIGYDLQDEPPTRERTRQTTEPAP